jgi:ceramide glucosyltransferase
MPAMTVVTIISAIAVAVSLLYYIAASVAALRFARRADNPPPRLAKIPPRIALLKPLHGSSESLGANIVSFLESSYPRLEVIFGVSSYDDPAAEIAPALKPGYQFANITLSVGEEPGCANRKVAKLIRMVERASDKTEIFVLSDADIAVEHEHLLRVVGELCADEKTGVVTCAYRARPAGALASRFEALYVNTDFFPMAILSAAIEPLRHAFGATIAIRRTVLNAIGGFRALKDVLADDFFVGQMVARRGYEVKLSSSIVTIVCEEQRFAEFWHHQLRWARTYRTVRPVSLATILIHGPFWALVMLAASGFKVYALAALGFVVAARLAMSAILFSGVLGVPEMLRDLWLVPLKDLMMTAIYLASLASNKVLWGGRRFRILAGGAMREVESG